MKRFILVVLDSVGAGAAPDAAQYNSLGANTLGHIAESCTLQLPCLEKLGLGNILPLRGVPSTENPAAAWGKMTPAAAGMDTTSGHWEIAGTPLQSPMPTFPQGFPPEVIDPFVAQTGRGVLGNRVASGVQIIQELGNEQVRTGKLIVYTSADSVFQIAAHEAVVPLDELYRCCRIARSLLVGAYGVGRVIARPFVGNEKDGYTRTENRRDFSLDPPAGNLLECCQSKHIPVTSIGKIQDIFAGKHIQVALPGHTNRQSMESLLHAVQEIEGGLLFANFVDFDMLYGHRNNPLGYAQALEQFDEGLPQVLNFLKEDDILAICADHGNDPTTPSTDHSREFVPLLVVGSQIKPVKLGVRSTFADLGQTAAEYLGTDRLPAGVSFLSEIL